MPGVVEMRQIAATVPFLMRSVMTWERGHLARIFLHLHPVPIFHPAQVVQGFHCGRLARKRARCPRSQGFDPLKPIGLRETSGWACKKEGLQPGGRRPLKRGACGEPPHARVM